MSDTHASLIKQLRALSEVDSVLARCGAQQRTFEQEQDVKQASFHKVKASYEDQKLNVDQKQSRYQIDEDRLKGENLKLVERRKVLSTFSNYKVQQSAQKEIEQSAKQLSTQEEKLLVGLEALEAEEAKLNELKEQFDTQKEDFDKSVVDVEEEIDALLERVREKEIERQGVVGDIPPKELALYDRIRARHPMDPLVPLKGGNCGGCFMQLGPQVLVQVSRAETLVKCRGCGRLLYKGGENGEESSSPSAS